MARTRVEPPRTTAHVLSWLRRGRREEIPVELVLDVIRSVHGVIPLGGRMGGADGATPPATPKTSALSLFSAGKDAKDAGDASQDQSDDKRWTILLSSVQLPASGGQQELRNALEALHDDKQSQKPLDIETLRRKFFAERRDFFAVRVELLRAASNPQHPNAQVAEEAVDELLKEGLREALLDEVHGRQFTQQPSFTGVGAAERKALVAWELQFLEEEALLRELLLLTLVASREKATLESALKITKTVYNWEARVFDEVFTVSTLALPAAQETARKLTQVGLLVALRLLHSTGAVQEHAALQQVTKSFFLTELCGVPDSTSEEPVVSPVPGVLLLAWATLLGRQYREVAGFNRETQEVKELEVMLQHTLAAAEHRHSFHYLNALLRSLVFRNDYGDSDSTAFLHPLSLHAKKLWTLPSVAASAGLRGAKTTPSPYLSRDSASIYQHVVAAFLSDMLSSLGYMENLDVALQLHAMVKFVLPALSNARVAQQTLGIDAEESNMTDIVASGETAALRDLLTKARANLPHSLLSCVQMFTALCCSYQDVSSPAVLRQVLKYFNKPRAGLEGRMITSGVCRPAPPAEYISEIAGVPGRVTCTRSFAYDDEDSRLVVPAGTRGTIVQSGEEVQIEWLLADSDEDKHASSLWDLLMLSADSFVAGLQSGSFANLHRTDTEDASVLTAFFEFIVQLGQQHDGGKFVIGEMKRRWGEARLRRWWTEHRLPSPEYYVPQLVRQQIALSTLLSASRENLVSWDIRDRHVREQILAQIGSVERHDFGSVIMGDASTMNSFTVDGGIHLLRLLLGVLDGFLHASPGAADAGESAWAAGHLHLVAASFIALRTLLATTSGVELLMNASLGGGREECVNLIVKSAKKLFELHERLTGEYPVVLATQEIFMSVVRWFLSKEAQGLADPASTDEGSSGSHAFVAMERLWFVGAAEFAIEVLSTHESWKFVSTSERCEVTERCFRLLYVLVLPRKYIHEQNEMAPAFETALRETLSTDMSLLMKLLRSSCALLSSMEGQLSGDDEETNSEVDESDTDDDTAVDFVQFESLVTTCLRFVALLLSNEKNGVDTQAARKILLTPIDGGSKTLTIVTLCGVYLGYSLDDASGIAYWSLQILQHAAVMLDYRLERESRDLTSMHSLVALFHGYQDLPLVRGTFAQLLRVSSPPVRKEVIELLTLCLEHQPGFLALLLFGIDSKKAKNDDKEGKAEGDPLPFVALLERFFEASEKLLEQSSDLFCALLAFLVQVWEGAIHKGLGVHLEIMAALRARSTFWPNVSRALKIHMPLESVEERGLLDMELAAATAQGRGAVESPSSSSELYIGRSSAYGYLARGLILQLVSYEWHNHASKQSDHPLVDVLESFRKEGLYSHWLRTFTRLDYSPTQLEQYASCIRRACSLKMSATNLLSDIPVGGISMYVEGLICDASTLKWQLSAGGDFKLQTSPEDVRALKLVQWSNLQAAYLHAQLFSLAKWKVFMELCCLQAGIAETATDTEKESQAATPRRLKRKESMISSPPRSTTSAGSPSMVRLSTASSSDSILSSRFSGDRTSFGMIQVLVDVIKIRVNQHENQDETLDFFVLVHLHDLVQLLVSMLHHQLCLVVRKTRDPKLSQTRQRLEGSKDSNLKFDTGATLELLSVIEKTASAVHDAMKQIARELELMRLGANSNSTLASSIELSAVPLIARLVTDFERKVESVTDELYTSLFTAALLLVRHLSKINRHPSRINDGDTNMESMSPPKPLLQVKLIGHCMNAISLCDDRPQSTRSTQALFQLSWCLFQEVLDSFSSVDSAKPKLRMANAVQLNPFVKELEHDQQGVGALFHLLVQRFRPSCNSKQVAARQEEAYQVLRGLTAVVWNPANTELCQRVMLKASSSRSSSRLRLLSMLATELLPLLQTQMEREETSSKLRGYVSSLSSEADDDMEEKSLDRSLAHRMWCLVLDFVGGLLRMPSSVDAEDADVWEFMSHAEALLLAAVQPTNCQRLTRAGVTEHQAVLRLLSALSGTASRRQRWRQAFPTNVVVLMEQSRQLLGRSCVLLGSSSAEMTRLRKEKTQKQKVKSPTKAIVGFGASLTPKSPRSPSAFTFAHQTLLHDQLQAVREVEKRKLTDFHREMEWELVEIVRLSSLLLAKWTASLTDRDAILVVDGVRYVDEDQLVPLLAFIPPSEARSMNSSPGLGHLSLAMDFMLDELLADEDTQTNATEKTKAVLANAIDSCALLFLKTYLLHAEQFELAKRDRDELKNFFRQFNARLSGCDGVDIDAQLLEHIGKIIAG
ncbi:hypothetical protein PC116_g7397 [Phytophthora cactorum]|uniref:Uncharacterized protein n=1 Tax=Phytophthora cactorum TaxID=29920 RepID=A0A8T1E4V0_9STRA|nr:hypothetical protein PC111_g7450 [Phytophthora cactorum]KAG2834510.1 hypothetical protein PC112_g6060 [Phytophthora cactorum]KAG2862578.1 hypothetical protein PC113_g6180 [Phytophthora cactorum]KAG2948507.1 hypothetical protein PC117_g5959 [Phytophthora cactorum]KAG2992789.1 hypothetical protein PC118_g4353 [Phytophthora cactorum]